jgi:(p)ppGpp synthase/HD superfamily hydrolase
MKVELAFQIAIEAHQGQVDKAGKPYVFHPIHLALKFMQHDYRDLLMQLAVLHDVKEDNKAFTTAVLLERGIEPYVIVFLDFLTHKKGEPYEEYIERIATSRFATMVKIADLEHNMDLTRLKKVGEMDLMRVKKYQKAKDRLEKALEEMGEML